MCMGVSMHSCFSGGVEGAGGVCTCRCLCDIGTEHRRHLVHGSGMEAEWGHVDGRMRIDGAHGGRKASTSEGEQGRAREMASKCHVCVSASLGIWA